MTTITRKLNVDELITNLLEEAIQLHTKYMYKKENPCVRYSLSFEKLEKLEKLKEEFLSEWVNIGSDEGRIIEVEDELL